MAIHLSKIIFIPQFFVSHGIVMHFQIDPLERKKNQAYLFPSEDLNLKIIIVMIRLYIFLV